MYLPFFVFGGVLSRPDCTIYSALLQLPYTRIISRPLLSFFVISSTTTTIFFPIARFEIESFFLTASRHFFHHCHLITNNPLIPILILRILAQPLWRSVSTSWKAVTEEARKRSPLTTVCSSASTRRATVFSTQICR